MLRKRRSPISALRSYSLIENDWIKQKEMPECFPFFVFCKGNQPAKGGVEKNRETIMERCKKIKHVSCAFQRLRNSVRLLNAPTKSSAPYAMRMP